jgi:hypothetical protein
MPKARDYHLTEQEMADVEVAIRRDKRPEVRHMVGMIDGGVAV